jgi:hypothetical protein
MDFEDQLRTSLGWMTTALSLNHIRLSLTRVAFAGLLGMSQKRDGFAIDNDMA